MSLEECQLVDDKIKERDFLKIYHQQGANPKNPDYDSEFVFGENINDHQMGNAYFQFDITVRKIVAIPVIPDFRVGDELRFLKIAFAYFFKEARSATTIGSHIEINKYPCHVSTIMRVLTGKDGDLMPYFDKINENEINDASKEQKFSDNHTVAANKEQTSGQLPLEHIFVFSRLLRK